MKFGVLIIRAAIPEWRICYINYSLMKHIITIIKHIHRLNKNDELITQEDNNQNGVGADIAMKANMLFFSIHQTELQVTFMFFQMKLIEIRDKYNEYKVYSQAVDRGNPHFISLIQNLYIQTHYVKNLYEINIEGERKVLKKHKKTVKELKLPSPVSSAGKLHKLRPIVNSLIDKMQDLYIQKSRLNLKQARIELRNLVSQEKQHSASSFLFGVGIGAGIAIIILIIVLLNNAGIGIDSDKQFIRDFPVWRGLAIFIMYIWVLGLNVYAFERFHVSHKLIFKFSDYHASSSTQIFSYASIFSSLYLTLFLLYVIQRVTNQEFFGIVSKRYLGAMLWIILLLFIALPLPIFNHKGRLYAWKLIGKSLISPLYVVDFPVVWMTDQFVSLTNPLKDFAYTICYYTRVDFSNLAARNPCSSNTNVEIVFIVGMVVLLYRILQCINQGYHHGVYFRSPFFFNTIKYSVSLLTLLLSFLYNAASPAIFTAWVVFAGISTIYSYAWDLKMDWNLFEPGARHRFLREDLIYHHAKFYYMIMVLNLVMRLSWIFTLSPSMVAALGIKPVLFTLLTSAIQIIRRGIWNLFRVQKEHIVNCKNFKAVDDQEQTKKRLLKEISPLLTTSARLLNPSESTEQIRMNKLRMSLFKKVQHKKKMIRDIDLFLSEAKKEIKRLSK